MNGERPPSIAGCLIAFACLLLLYARTAGPSVPLVRQGGPLSPQRSSSVDSYGSKIGFNATFEQTKSTGPRWEHDHPVPTSALAALAQLDAHVTARAPAALPPATEVAPPVLKRQRSSGVRTLLEDKIRPLVEFLREHEDREANGTAQRCSSPSSSPSSSLRFEPADALSAAEHIERILGRQGDPDHRWRCLGLEPCAGTLPRTLLRKRFLALALLVHPDKCHLEGAHEAFATLEKAFRELAEER